MVLIVELVDYQGRCPSCVACQ